MPPGSLDQDWQLRLAAFDALRRIVDATGGVIGREQMTAGFDFQGDRIPFADRGRGIWRPQRLGPDGAALSVVTAAVRPGQRAPYDDGLSSDEGWLAYRYQRNGPESWDNVAVRRAFQAQRPIIYFSGVKSSLYSAVCPMYVIADDLESQTFHLASVGATVADPVEFIASVCGTRQELHDPTC